MIRVRFSTHDERPVNWPVLYPFWCSGYDGADNAIVVSYADNLAYIKANWPGAFDMTFKEVNSIEFTSRFPKPSWYEQG